MLTRAERSIRTLVAGCLLLVAHIVSAPDAAAHSAGNAPSSNYIAHVVSIVLQDGVPLRAGKPSFDLRSIEAGSRLELRWRSGPELSVPDYDGNPYLRVGPDGVFQNEQSAAVYLNKDRNGATDVPETLNPTGPPKWKRLSSDAVVRWHDHRGHRMGGDPPQVRKAPGKPHLVQREVVVVLQGASPDGAVTTDTVQYNATVEVRWKPGSSKLPWLAAAALLALGLSLASTFEGRTLAGRKRLRPLIILAAVALLVADVVHLVGIAFGIRSTFTEGLTRTASIGFASFAAWIATLVGLWMYLRKRTDGLYLVTFGAGLMTMVGGLADLSTLSASSIPFAFAPVVARVVITLTIGLGIGLVVAGVLLTRPTPEELPSDDTSAGQVVVRT